MFNKIKRILPVMLIFLTCQAGIAQQKEMREAFSEYNSLQFNTAAEKYLDAISKMKEDDLAQRNFATFMLAECYRMMNDYEMAEMYFKELSEGDFGKTNPVIYLRWAEILQASGEALQAMDYYRKYLKEDPRSQAAKLGVKSCDWMMVNEPRRARVNISNETELNSPNDDFAPKYYSNAFDKLVLTSNRTGAIGKKYDEWWGAPYSDLFVSALSGNKWTNPSLLDNTEVINTEVHEGAACFNEDFSRMYFTRCERWDEKARFCSILVSGKTGDSWGEPEVLFADTSANYGQPALSKDELTLVFSSNIKGGEGGKDLYVAKRKTREEPFGNPVNMGTAVNSFGNEMFPYLFNDTVLYYSSDGFTGYGGLDIYRSVYRNNSWSKPENLFRPINSGYDDFGFILRSLSDEGYYQEGYLTSNRPSGTGGDDIYRFTRRTLLFTLAGQVKDNMTLLPIMNARAELVRGDGREVEVYTDAEGRFFFDNTRVLEDTDYELAIRKENYFASLQTFSTRYYEDDFDFILNTSLEPIPEKPIVLPDILYPLDQWILLPQYQDSLRGLVKLMSENPSLVIELRSHTDSRGSFEYNDVLSQKRAQSVVDFMIGEGIDPGRMVAKGYGERVFRILDKDITREGFDFKTGTLLDDDYIYSLPTKEIQEAAFQLNRRTEFAVIAKDYKAGAEGYQEKKPTIEVVSDSSVISIDYTLSPEGEMMVFSYINDFKTKTLVTMNAVESVIGEEIVLDLLRKGAINRKNFEGNFDEIMIDGHIIEEARLTLSKIRLAELVVNDVVLTVKPGDLFIMGEDLLSEFGEFKIDTEKQQIIFK
jgi:peptidoglycan-associated lipoprotein